MSLSTCFTTVDFPICRAPITTWINLRSSSSRALILWYSVFLYISSHFTQWSAYFYAVQIYKKYSTHAKPNEKSRFPHFCVIRGGGVWWRFFFEFFCEFGGKRQNNSFKIGKKQQKWHYKIGGKRHFGIKYLVENGVLKLSHRDIKHTNH